ncbi:hypothetical protein RB195_007657 [Necator americanus]|uniref:Reverse transcriptase domain-containing protein n=1 Tax=Necator americanus TaxID=51031 RepID=A0ABR1C0Y4_NECAM
MLNEAQSQEQAEFRQGFGYFDHIQTVLRIIEICHKCRLPFFLTFVDREKAFNSIETNAVLSALIDQGVDASYMRTSANCYDQCTTTTQLFYRPLTISIGKGVRYYNYILQRRYYIVEDVHDCTAMDNEITFVGRKDIRVDGRFLSNLRFADDIALVSSSTNEADTMVKELDEAGKRIGLRINRKETETMKNAYCGDEGIQLEGSQIVETLSYVYLGRSMNMENKLKEEPNRMTRAAWAAFARMGKPGTN